MTDSPVKTAKVSTIAFGGDGIVRDDDFVVFIPFVIPEETVSYHIVRKKSHFGYGTLDAIDTPSPDRISAVCPYFGQCPGCQFQHIAYPRQLEIKKRFVTEALERIAKITPPPFEVVGSSKTYEYRQHIRLNLDPAQKGFKAGYRTGKALLEVDHCPIFTFRPLIAQMGPLLKEMQNEGIESASCRLFKLNESEFLAAFSFAPHLPQNHASLMALAPSEISSVWMQAPGKRVIYGKQEIRFSFLEKDLPISPYVFTQNNADMAKALYDMTLSFVPTKPHKILDLYCGIGLLSDRLADFGHTVLGVESHAEAIHLAKARGKAKFLIGAVESLFKDIQSKGPFDTILINPPREGAHPDVIDLLLLLKPERILYTSCMPATLARDIARLKGYRLTGAYGFDLFPQTTHLETLAILERS